MFLLLSREDCMRYRKERNIFRAKYEDLKSKHNITSTAKSKTDSVLVGESSVLVA